MQTPRLTYLATLLTALGCATINVGCSSTPTRESLGEAVDDSVITSKVKTALIGDRDVSAMRINVETFRGTVQLSGFARTEDEKLRAAELARDVRGVRAVKNDIRLREDQ